MQNILPENNIVGKAALDKGVLGSPDWQAAKEQHDYEAARRIVAGQWSSKKTEKLSSFFKKSSNVIFISQPTSSGNNILPVVFAKKLSVDFDTTYVVGDKFFNCSHEQQSKHIPRHQRPFNKRKYRTENIEGLRCLVGNKDVVVVEDILTTGGSVAQFVRSLNEEKIEVKSVVALMGDRRLNIDSKTLGRLSDSLNKADIPISAHKLSEELTRTEAGIIIVTANSARSENAKQNLTRKLQGILDQSPYRNLGRDQDPGRHKGPGISDNSHEATAERISPGRVLGIGRTEELKETHHFEISVKEKFGETHTKQVFVNPKLVSKKDLGDYLEKKENLFVSSLGIEKHNISETNIRPVEVKIIRSTNIEMDMSH